MLPMVRTNPHLIFFSYDTILECATKSGFVILTLVSAEKRKKNLAYKSEYVCETLFV